MTGVTGYAWACLSVTELGRSVEWFRSVLNLDVFTTNADTCAIAAADRFTYLIDPISLFVIGLQQTASNDGGAFQSQRTGLDHLTVSAGSDGLAGWQHRFDHLGVAYVGPIRWAAGSFIECRDPDGIPIRVFQLS